MHDLLIPQLLCGGFDRKGARARECVVRGVESFAQAM